MTQVMIKQARLHGDPVLVVADVLTASDDSYRVKVPGALRPIIVKKSDIIPIESVYGQPRPMTTIPTKDFGAPHSMAARYNK